MSLLQALLLGLVQGITEFLPVSSSGHLAIMQNLLNINTDTGVLFDVILHLGTLTAIFIAFWKDIKKLILDGCGMIYDIIQNCKIWSHNRREHDARRYKKIVSTNYRKFILLIVCLLYTSNKKNHGIHTRELGRIISEQKKIGV